MDLAHQFHEFVLQVSDLLEKQKKSTDSRTTFTIHEASKARRKVEIAIASYFTTNPNAKPKPKKKVSQASFFNLAR